MSADVRIGISGWRYPEWRGVFYSKGLVQRRELEFASRELRTIEINGAVAETMLPYVKNRPLMLVRCPDGTPRSVFRQGGRRDGKKTGCFVQKHSGQGISSANLGSTTVAATKKRST